VDVALDLEPDAPDPSDVEGPETGDVPADPGPDLPADVAGDAGAVQCWGANPTFPGFDKACDGAYQCGVGLHQTDCCGNRVALGLVASQMDAFDDAEAICDAQYPDCECAQGPIAADDGGSTYDPAEIKVACVDGECRTFVNPCAAAEAFEAQNACASDDDCALVFHQVNCCGTYVAWGILGADAPAFAHAETICEGTYPACGCASQPTLAQDGNEGSGFETFSVRCVQGSCRSYVPDKGWRCHTPADCPNGEMCLAPGEKLPCGMCFEPENTCAADPDCPEGTVCELVTGGCTCYAATQCVPACNLPASTACPVGQACADSGRCVDQPCSADADCPWLFACVGVQAPVCARKACFLDDECGGGRCVEGACHEQLGSCVFPPP
jgi:hypothetical protein